MFRINPASGKAIYEQIMEQVKEAAWKGYLKPGDALPSVRKLALSLSVTPNTVAKAYQLLEKEKVIITIRGKGAFLAENASQEVDKGKMQEIKTSLKEILSELRYEGYDEEKIASLIHEIYQDLEGEDMKVIELKDVKKSYGKNEILHGISLDIEEGSIHGLVGRNGCVKTTLIKCLTGIYEQDQGQILVCGEEIFENPKVKAQVGYVADSNQYFEGYHIDEMVEFYKQIYPTFDEKVFRDYNQSIGLDVSKRIKELSKGQAMSLASMLNLSIHPKVMIMDEPMSGLDVIAQKQIKDFIVNEVDMNGMSVLISSHDLKDLESFCDSASMMKDGKILYHGTMDQMKERFTKLQVVFEESRSEIFKELPGVITYSNLGSVYTVILEGYGEPIHEALKQAGAIVVEEIPLSLEEVFVYSNR